jgi:F-type H+-transporting ATPase subunit c
MKNIKLAFAAIALVLCTSLPALAQGEAAPAAADSGDTIIFDTGFAKGMGVALGAGMIILGAAYGISLIGSRAVESMARQPEVAGNINGAMIVSAALIEGATFFALIVVLLILILA